jgi:hypothetical protein
MNNNIPNLPSNARDAVSQAVTETIRLFFSGIDEEMRKRLVTNMKPGDLTVRGNEALSCALAALRQLGMGKTALAIEEYITGGRLT